MKANRSAQARKRSDEDSGVSTVLGAILLFGLLVLTLVRIRTQFAPIWTHDREADLMDGSVNQLSVLKSDLERQVTSGAAVTVTDHLNMGTSGGFSFFEEPDRAGTVTFTPGAAGTGIRISASTITLEAVAGQSLGALQTYTTLTATPTTNVLGVATLKVRLDNPMSAGNGAALRIDVTDSVGACAGQLIATVGAGAAPPRNIALQTYNNYSGSCVASPLSSLLVHQSDTLIGCVVPCVSPTTYFFDALEPTVGLASILAKTATPYTITFVLTGTPAMTASGVFAYDQAVTGGTARVGGGGYTATNYATTIADGTLTYKKQNNRFATQTYTLEYGALILDQGAASVMVATPAFSVTSTAAQSNVKWVVPALTGIPNQVGGTKSATITAAPNGPAGSLSGLTPSVAFTLNTIHPGVWVSYFQDAMARAGFTSGTHYTVVPSGNTVVITINGPLSSGNDVRVDFQSIPLSVTLQPGS